MKTNKSISGTTGACTKAGSIAFPMHAWVVELGISDTTLRARLNKTEEPYKSGELISGRRIMLALRGDKDAALVAKLEAETRKLVREEAKEPGLLYTREEIESLFGEPLEKMFVLVRRFPKEHGAQMAARLAADNVPADVIDRKQRRGPMRCKT